MDIRSVTWICSKNLISGGLNASTFTSCRNSVNELFLGSRSSAFLVPILSKVCKRPVSLAEIGTDIKIDYFQKGLDAVIAEVFVPVAGLGEKSFILNISKSAEKNADTRKIFENMARLFEINPKYIVEPLVHCESRGLSIFATQSKRDYYEINVAKGSGGERMVLLNKRGESSIPIEDGEAEKILEEMIKIRFLYADGQIGTFLDGARVNSGDFIYKKFGDPMLFLVTARYLNGFQEFSNNPNYQEIDIRVMLFFQNLGFNTLEVVMILNDIKHQLNMKSSK